MKEKSTNELCLKCILRLLLLCPNVEEHKGLSAAFIGLWVEWSDCLGVQELLRLLECVNGEF